MQDILFALSVVKHPIDGFWDLKHEKRGKPYVAVLILVFYFLVSLFNRQMRSFIFNDAYNTPINLFYEIRLILIPFALFCIANWSVTVLMDGKGKFIEIIMVTGYSLLPAAFVKMFSAIISNVFSKNELLYLNLIDLFGYLCFFVLLFIGISSIHEYSISKTIAIFVLTMISIIIIVFISLLFFSLLQEIVAFLYSIYREIMLRLL